MVGFLVACPYNDLIVAIVLLVRLIHSYFAKVTFLKNMKGMMLQKDQMGGGER